MSIWSDSANGIDEWGGTCEPPEDLWLEDEEPPEVDVPEEAA